MKAIDELLKRNGLTKFQTSLKTSFNGKQYGPPKKLDICSRCGGRGFFVPNVLPDDPRFGRAVVCTCKARELERKRDTTLERMSQLGALREHTFKAFVSDGIGLSAEKAQNLHRAYQRCKAFAEQPEGWLLLKGSYGCGKTHLAAAIANRRLELKETVLFVNTPDLLDHLRSTYRPNSPHSYDQRFQQVRDTPLLILDDLGAQNNSDWAQEKLYQIFNHRYNARLPTVVTTNEDIDSIEIRIRSRLSDFGLVQIIPITAPDFRRGGRYHEESDLSSLHLHSDKTFETFSLRTTELLRPQATNLRKAYNLTRTFAEDPQGWIVLNSTAFGNGKTHLAAAVANTYSSRGEKVLFIVVPDLLDHLRSTFSPSVSARLDKRFNEVKTVPLLVLDDLGTESATAWAREKLYQLFNYRFNAKLPTIITTTTQFNQLDQRLASRFYSPLCQFFLLEAPSYRGDMKLRRNRK